MLSSTHVAKLQKFGAQFQKKMCSSKFLDFYDLHKNKIPKPKLKLFNNNEYKHSKFQLCWES